MRPTRRDVEGLNDARTILGTRRISVRRGRAGEKGDFFSILLVHHTTPTEQLGPIESRPWHQQRRQQVEIAEHDGRS